MNQTQQQEKSQLKYKIEKIKQTILNLKLSGKSKYAIQCWQQLLDKKIKEQNEGSTTRSCGRKKGNR
jgi:hypothetical protein